MRNIYSVGRLSRFGSWLLMLLCSLTVAWAQDALQPYAVYYDLGDMPTIRQIFANNGQQQRTPSATPTTALKTWNTDDAVPEYKFYKNTSANSKQGSMSYYVISPSTGLSRSQNQRAVGGDFIIGQMGWNRNCYFKIQTPWLNPGKYRVYMATAWDNNNKYKNETLTELTLDGEPGTLGKSYYYAYQANLRTYGQQKEVLVTNAEYTRYDFGAFLGYVTVAEAGQHELTFTLNTGGGETDGTQVDMLQFIPVTAADADADYIWPKFDVGGNAHFEGYNPEDVVDVVGEGGSQGKKFYQVKDPSVYASAAVAKFGLEANKDVTVYRSDKWTRIAEFTTNADGQAVATLPAGDFYWAYDDDLSWTLNEFSMEGEDKVIGDDGDFSEFEGQAQTLTNALTEEEMMYGYAGMPFSLSSGLGFESVVSDNEDVAIYEDGLLKFVSCGEANITVTSAASDFYATVSETFAINVAKAPLTISVGNYDKKLHEDMPEFEIVYSGFKLGETEEDLISPAVASCDAVKESTRGEYPITLSGAESDNYEITYENGVLTIGRLDQVVTFDQDFGTLVYGDTLELTAISDAELEVSFYSADENIVRIDGNMAYMVGAGSTTITAFQTGNEDYLPSADVVKNITVGKRPLSVIADNNLGLQGAAAPVFGYHYEGFIFGDDESAISTDPEFVTDGVTDGIVTGDLTEYSNTNDPLNAYSVYMIPTTGIADNYELQPVPGTFVVIAEKMKQTILFDEFTPTYKGTLTLNAVAYSAGRKSTYVPTNLPVRFESSDPSVLKIEGDQLTAIDFGEDIVVTAIVEGNDTYYEESVEMTVSVAKAPITIRANDVERTVFNPDPEFSYTVSGDFLFDDTEETIREILSDATITTTARFRSKAGRYLINVNGIEESDYYQFIYEPGYITIHKAATEIVDFGGASFTIAYGDRADITAKVVSDFIASTGEAGIVQVPYMTSADSTIADIYVTENVSYVVGNGLGTTNVYAYFPGNDYYEASPEVTTTHEVIVVPREITLIADDASRYASQPNPEFTYSAVGLSSTYKVDDLEELFQDPQAVRPVLKTDADINSMRGDTYEIYFDNSETTPYLPNYDIVGYKSGHLTITGGVQQTIAFGFEQVKRIETGNPSEFKYKLSATASSGLTVTYSLANPSVECATLNGDILTFDTSKPMRNLTIIAHQPGNNYYGAADDRSIQFGLVQFHGTVTDSSTYEPIPNATVRIYREQNIERTPEQIAADSESGRITYPVSDIYDLVDEVLTDGDGYYASTYVQGLSRFKIEVIAGEGYMNLYYNFLSNSTARGSNAITYTWSNPVTTRDPQVLSGSSYLRDFEIPPQTVMKGAASVEGKVFVSETSDFVNSVEDVTVYLFAAVNPKSATPRFTLFYSSQIPTPEINAAWKSSGTYKFENIPWGKYFLGISYPGGNAGNLSTGFIFTVDSASLDTAYYTRDFMIVDRDAYAQTITASEDDIAASLVDVNIYPNPTTNGIFNIATAEGEYTLTITNAAQQTVYAAKVSSALYQVDLSGQADGLYIVRLDFGGKQIVKKVTLLK
ncbi:MAG: T9SS type A sorting domain-containing protein [Bacteroidales bacterium]|nr:T9SS type A sorting domain-containing protein [Bacteroidales bacterium]